MSKFIKSLIASRQAKANYELARSLHRFEFRDESFEYILDMVNKGTIHAYIARSI